MLGEKNMPGKAKLAKGAIKTLQLKLKSEKVTAQPTCNIMVMDICK